MCLTICNRAILFWKLLLVTFVMWSPGQELAMTLVNLFITVGAFGAQCWKRPFANVDANRAESATLFAQLLVLILGLGSGTADGDDSAGAAQLGLNYAIYVAGEYITPVHLQIAISINCQLCK
jgi:hypothetical protein